MQEVVARIAADKITKRIIVPGVTGESVAKLLRVLAKEAPKWNAPIVALAAQQNQSPFLTLIGCILSLRTKDETTAVACEKLFAKARTPAAMLALAPKALEKLIAVRAQRAHVGCSHVIVEGSGKGDGNRRGKERS